MRKSSLALLLAATFLAGTAVAVVQADPNDSSGPMMRNGMMGRDMMGRMSRMMSGCGAMMHGGSHSGRPNEQWRNAPSPQN